MVEKRNKQKRLPLRAGLTGQVSPTLGRSSPTGKRGHRRTFQPSPFRSLKDAQQKRPPPHRHSGPTWSVFPRYLPQRRGRSPLRPPNKHATETGARASATPGVSARRGEAAFGHSYTEAWTEEAFRVGLLGPLGTSVPASAAGLGELHDPPHYGRGAPRPRRVCFAVKAAELGETPPSRSYWLRRAAPSHSAPSRSLFPKESAAENHSNTRQRGPAPACPGAQAQSRAGQDPPGRLQLPFGGCLRFPSPQRWLAKGCKPDLLLARAESTWPGVSAVLGDGGIAQVPMQNCRLVGRGIPVLPSACPTVWDGSREDPILQ